MTGLVAAPFTPMQEDGSLALDRIAAYATHLRESGLAGIFVNGTTGEGYSLSTRERIATAEEWIRHQTDSFRVMVHVGAESITDARELASHAQSTGAHAIGAMTPVFFKPTLDLMVRWCADIIEAAPATPFYYYHMPGMTGASFSVPELLERAARELPGFRGVKYTHNDMMEYRLCAAVADGRFDMLFGRDEILLSALVLGAKGMVGSTYNFAMPLFHNLMTAFESGRLVEADAIQHRVMELVQILIANGGGVVCGKAMMRGVGLDLGPCRLPNPRLSREQATAAVEAARRIGVFG
jgi:N-acetylneuraminate lyase